jgi:hypothetical protein
MNPPLRVKAQRAQDPAADSKHYAPEQAVRFQDGGERI